MRDNPIKLSIPGLAYLSKRAPQQIRADLFSDHAVQTRFARIVIELSFQSSTDMRSTTVLILTVAA